MTIEQITLILMLIAVTPIIYAMCMGAIEFAIAAIPIMMIFSLFIYLDFNNACKEESRLDLMIDFYIKDVNNELVENTNNITDDLTNIISNVENTYIEKVEVEAIPPTDTELVKIDAVHKNIFIFYRKDYVYTISYGEGNLFIRVNSENTYNQKSDNS